MSQWITGYQVWLSESQSLQNAQLVADHFSATDWTPESISALCGNMRHESSINPDMYEYGYSWDADRGYGLVQWTPRSKYWSWATSRGLDQRSGNSQLARIDYEVENNIQWIPISRYNNMTFSQFRQNSGNWSVEYLTEAFTWSYERPNAEAGESSMPQRKAFAVRCLNELRFDGQVGGSKPAFPTTEGLEITSGYGMRWHPIHGVYRFHAAIDIGGGGVNHPIYATQNGEVYANYWSDSAGWVLRIKHTNDPYYSQYIHLDSQSPISIGTNVTKGQEIGTMGTTGNSTGIHLDFAIAISENGFFTEQGTIDPEIYLDMTFGGGDENVAKNKSKMIIGMLMADTLNGWKW